MRALVAALAVVVALLVAALVVAVAAIHAFDRTNGTLVSSGAERQYLLHVPESYDAARSTALVISLHAGATWPAQQMNLSGWNRLADEQGFIVVYPAGTPQIFGVVRIWHTFEVDARVERDVRFISDLIDSLRADYNIDPARIYADGMSNGGGMAFVLSCALSERIAAVGMVAPAQALPPDWCKPTRPVPVIAFYGAADAIVPYAGGPLGDPFNPVKPVFPAAQDFAARWAARNGCAAAPVESAYAPQVTRLEYSSCAWGSAVVLNRVSGAGHVWPGGKPLPEWRVGSNTDAVDATAQLWAFFTEHPLRGAQTAAASR